MNTLTWAVPSGVTFVNRGVARPAQPRLAAAGQRPALAFGVLSALARAIGILRWLMVMPTLATSHAAADAAGRAQIEWVFQAVTLFGGGIGELLGVSLFMAISLGVLCAAAWRAGSLPKVLAAPGLLSALLLASLFLPVLRLPAVVPMAVAVTLLSLWMLATGVWLLRRPAA